MVNIGIAPATGRVTLTPRWTIGPNLAGFHHMAQDLGLTGSSANNFYSIRNGAIPAGGDILAYNFYVAGSGAATPHNDIGSKLTPNSYSALTSADPDVGYGAVRQYLIHHKGTTDYFTVITPGSAVASAVTDLKPMSGPGGPATVTGVSGYFGLTFAASNLGYGLNMFYYLRTDPVTSITKFGSLSPALAGTGTDLADLPTGGHSALAFTGTDVGYGVDKMYYLRLDPITGFTILGMLDPTLAPARRTSDIANLGSVYTTLTFVPADLTLGGANQFYSTGAVNPTWQSVSFAAIPDKTIAGGSFTVTPSASSNLPITLTIVPGSIGSATISAPVAGVFTITPTAPGLITLQATQAGQTAPVAFEYNMLRQSFTISGAALLAISAQPSPQTAAVGGTANFSVTANGTTAISYQWRKNGVNITGNASATTSTLTLTNVQASDAASYYVLVTNASGSIPSDSALLTVTGTTPAITNSPLTAAGTVGTAFNFGITASGSPTSFTASPLPAGVTLNGTTGVISGTPTAAGTTFTVLNAINASGTSSPATLTITVAAAAVAPSVTSPTTAPGTVGAAFSYTITATGSPTSFTASPLPAGVTLNGTTGVLSGTPTVAATTVVAMRAINAVGTSSPVTLTITVAPAAVAPIITSPTTAPATAGTVFVTYVIAATGLPTSFTATGLAPGLVINPATGAITGTPSTPGVFVATINATNSTGTGSSTLTITVAPTAPPPVPTFPPVLTAPIITSPTTAPGTAGTVFVTYAIAATSLPTSYSATGLPAGLTIDSLTGRISGTPTNPGTYIATISAINNAGTGSATLTIVVGSATVPIITSPTTAPGTVGTPFVTYLVGATGLPTSYTATGLPPGLTINTLTGAINGTPTTAGTYVVTVTATNSAGSNSSTVTMIVAAAAVAPIIVSPTTASATAGRPFVTYFIDATGLPTSFSATGLPAGLTLNTLTGAINGTPTASGTSVVTITATNSTGTSTTSLTIVVASGSRIVNFSARALSGPGSQTLIMGFVVQGDGKNLLVRGIGPGLTAFGITNALADPMLTLYGPSGTILATNDDWQTNTTGSAALIASTGARVGAFALAANSKDSALLSVFNNGAHTTSMLRPASTTGVALTEIYDTDVSENARLINVSARMMVSPGEGTLIAGLVINGTESKTVLIRGIGPTLSVFGVTGVLADPQIAVFSGNTQVASNDNWEVGTSTAAQVSSRSAQVGAFALAAGSRDAAMLITLQPGSYTVHVTGVAGASGVALIEVYDTQ